MSDDNLRGAISEVLNAYCRENKSNTPDFILAQFLMASLDAFDAGIRRREQWYGRDPDRGPGTECGETE